MSPNRCCRTGFSQVRQNCFGFISSSHKQSPGAGSRMSVTMTKTEGVIVLTLISDPQSALPPICQILKGLCCSPVCCSKSHWVKRDQGTSQSLLGTMQIMIGLLTIGLGTILYESGTSTTVYSIYICHFWLGGLFTLFGTMCIVSEKHPTQCLVILRVILNLAGVACAITAIVLFTINFCMLRPPRGCSDDNYFEFPLSPEEETMCSEGKAVGFMILKSINVLLIVLSLLELSAVMVSIYLGMKVLTDSERTENQSPDDPELHKHLLEGVTSNPAEY